MSDDMGRRPAWCTMPDCIGGRQDDRDLLAVILLENVKVMFADCSVLDMSMEEAFTSLRELWLQGYARVEENERGALVVSPCLPEEELMRRRDYPAATLSTYNQESHNEMHEIFRRLLRE